MLLVHSAFCHDETVALVPPDHPESAPLRATSTLPFKAIILSGAAALPWLSRRSWSRGSNGLLLRCQWYRRSVRGSFRQYEL